MNGIIYEGSLEINIYGGVRSALSNWYWIVVAILGLVLGGILQWSVVLAKRAELINY